MEVSMDSRFSCVELPYDLLDKEGGGPGIKAEVIRNRAHF
jgi:hypothetical protein